MVHDDKKKLWRALPASRMTEAREVAQSLLDELELGTAPIFGSIMKAKRLARLLRDEDAQVWLDLEASGYPAQYHVNRLGTCGKYARSGGRFLPDNRYYTPSLPQYEAYVKTAEMKLAGLKFPTQVAPNVSSSNPNELTGIHLSNAVEKIVSGFNNAWKSAADSYNHNITVLNGMKSAIHSYATDCHHAISFGDAVERLFERARETVDRFIRATAPKAAEQLLAAFERFGAGDAESFSHALTSARRLLSTVADAVYPPREEPATDLSGKKRNVGPEQYKNRLLMFIEERIKSKTSIEILSAEMGHLADRLDAFYEKACKGVHADVSIDEVRLVLVSVYVFLAEILHASAGATPSAGIDAEGVSAPENGDVQSTGAPLPDGTV